MALGQKPNWGKWRQVLDVRLWEGIALSLDIEPDPSDMGDDNWAASFKVSEESKEFRERLFVATRNLPSEGGLAFTLIVPGEPSRSMVGLAQFAQWALSLGWKVPGEFADLGLRSIETRLRDKSDEERPLTGKGRATALKLILGLAINGYRYNPEAPRSPIPSEIAGDLQQLGISLTDETVREWLRMAAKEVDWQLPAKLSE